VGSPGLKLWITLAGGGVRGMLVFNKDKAYVVVGGQVYKVMSDGTSTALGPVPEVSVPSGPVPMPTIEPPPLGGGSLLEPVSMASNGIVVMIVTGPQGFVIDGAADTVTEITDPAFTGADTVTFIDGYFVFNKPGTGQFQITSLYGTTIDPLDFATAEGSPDLLLSVLADHRELWLFGETSTEVFFNSGNADFPFERIQGAFIEQGCAAKFSPAKLDNSVYWLTHDANGNGTVQKAQGYQPARVSDHALEFALQKMQRIDDAIAYTYQQDGHYFYVLNFPTAQQTWAYDAATQLWCERAWRDPADSILKRQRQQTQMFFNNRQIVGDWENGNLYVMSLDFYTDNGDLIPAIRRAPYLASTNNAFVFHHRLWVDCEVGVGLNGTGYGSDPEMILRWSDDGGRSFPTERRAPMGKIGEYRARAVFRRLGKSKARVYEITITDPVKRIVIAGDVETTPGSAG
jgi:hypothetical protein